MAKEIDVETGLPRLPEGWRWEVREYFPHVAGYGWGLYGQSHLVPASSKELWVRLSNRTEKTSRPLRKHWWSKTPDPVVEVNWDVKYNELTQGTAVAVFNAANKIYNRWQDDIDKRKLVGDYPPKSINANNQDA